MCDQYKCMWFCLSVSVRRNLQLCVGRLMSYLRYLCLLSNTYCVVFFFPLFYLRLVASFSSLCPSSIALLVLSNVSYRFPLSSVNRVDHHDIIKHCSKSNYLPCFIWANSAMLNIIVLTPPLLYLKCCAKAENWTVTIKRVRDIDFTSVYKFLIRFMNFLQWWCFYFVILLLNYSSFIMLISRK